MKPTTTIESLGSVWLIDENEKHYCRLPRTEGPRQSPPGEDWGGPDAGDLQDLVWHPYLEWSISRGTGRLFIQTQEDGRGVSAPVTRW